jgi:hypothetical protein
MFIHILQQEFLSKHDTFCKKLVKRLKSLKPSVEVTQELEVYYERLQELAEERKPVKQSSTAMFAAATELVSSLSAQQQQLVPEGWTAALHSRLHAISHSSSSSSS